MVLDFCPGGELFFHLRRLGRFNEEQARFYFSEITLAMEYLHNNGIIYRDLKPENVLLDYDGHIKLVDFGTSRENSRDSRRFTYCGSAEYMSPEMISKSGHSMSIDCFSIGSFLYEMLTGLPPFYDENQEKMFWKIQNEPLFLPKFISIEAKDLLLGLLNKDPSLRLGSEFISDIKDHPWCATIHWKKTIKKKVPPPIQPSFTSSNFDQEFTNIPINSEIFFEECLKPDHFDVFSEFDYYPNNFDTEVEEFALGCEAEDSGFCLSFNEESETQASFKSSESGQALEGERKGKVSKTVAPRVPENDEVFLNEFPVGMSRMKQQLMKKFNQN
jgi:serine/threonine protein kinase